MNTVSSILVPVDGSAHSDRAVRFVIGLYAKLAPVEMHVLHVTAPGAPAVTGEPAREDDAFERARALLDAASIPYVRANRQGYVAAEIIAYARAHHCQAIVMGTRGMGSTEDLLGSIARQVIRLADVPITLVP